MRKEIILLAASRKHDNLCIAGIDTTTGKWIRIVSEDSTISCAVNIYDIICTDGRVPGLFDIVSIECIKHQPNYYQFENYVYKPGSSWENLGRVKIEDVLRIHPFENKSLLFYNMDNKVHKDVILCSKEPKQSLMLIKPTNIIIHVQQWEKKRVKMSFDYNGVRYKYLTITDIEYERYYLAMDVNDYKLRDGISLVVSLGECYKDYHYKLIATILA